MDFTLTSINRLMDKQDYGMWFSVHVCCTAMPHMLTVFISIMSSAGNTKVNKRCPDAQGIPRATE